MGTGLPGHAPYAVALEAIKNRCGRIARTASKTFFVPLTLMSCISFVSRIGFTTNAKCTIVFG